MIDIKAISATIKKLNAYNELLEKNDVLVIELDDEDLQKEINDEVKQFIASKASELLGSKSVTPAIPPIPAHSATDPKNIKLVQEPEPDIQASDPIVQSLMEKYGYDPASPLEARKEVMRQVREEFSNMKSKKTESAPAEMADTGVNINLRKRVLNSILGK